jgi:hypothetical protein
MSNKRGLSKRQRLYYEYQNKEKSKEELAEMAKSTREVEYNRFTGNSFDPDIKSYYN